MVEPVVQRRLREPFKLHEGWLRRHVKDRKWEELWLVLKGNNIFIFTHEREHTEETHKGVLPINSNTTFERKTKDEKYNFYVFEITTRSDNKTYCNKFKTDRKSDMEMWRGYITGLSKGTLPDNLDLPPNTIEDMKILLERYNHLCSTSQRQSTATGMSRGSLDSGVEDISIASGYSGTERRSVTTRRTGSHGSGETRETLVSYGSDGTGGRNRRHIFNNDPYSDNKCPSWFFSNCSRDYAKKIFKNKGCRYGNTLMRESSSNAADGNYVISYCSEIKVDREPVCDHFRVIRTYGGFKLDIENPHKEMSNLTEVMKCFTQINGPERTYPMTTNDLTTLELEDPDYRYMQYVPTESQTKSFNVLQSLEEPPPDYLPPVASSAPKTYSLGMVMREHRENSQQRDNRVSYNDPRHRDVTSITLAARSSYNKRHSMPASMLSQPTLKERQRIPSDETNLQDLGLPKETAPPVPHLIRSDIYENDHLEHDDARSPINGPRLPSFPAPAPPDASDGALDNHLLDSNTPTDPPPPAAHRTLSLGYENDREDFDDEASRRYRSKSVPNFVPPSQGRISDILARRVTTSIVDNPPKSILVNSSKKEQSKQVKSPVNTSLSVTGLRHVEVPKSSAEPKEEYEEGVEERSISAVSRIAKQFEKEQVKQTTPKTKISPQQTQTPDNPRMGGGTGREHDSTPHSYNASSTYYNEGTPLYTNQSTYTNTNYPVGIVYENASDETYDDTINAGLYVRSTAKVIYGREKLRKKEKPDPKHVSFDGSKVVKSSQCTNAADKVESKGQDSNEGFRNELERVLQNRRIHTQPQDDDLYEALPELPEDEDT